MTKRASAKTLLSRRMRDSDFPIVVSRRWWAATLAAFISPIFIALTGLLAFTGVGAIPDFIADGASEGIVGLIRSLFGASIWILSCPLLLITAFLGIDRSFGYQMAIQLDGLRFDGVLTNRLLSWNEIRDIRLKPRVFLPSLNIYQVAHIAIYVDGLNHPRRHWSSLWFGYYDVPPLMELGGRDLVKLLRKAAKHLGKDVDGLN